MNNFQQVTLPLLGYGIIGIGIMAFAKMIDINLSSKDHSFGGVFKRFLAKEWPSYGMSILIMIALAFTNNEWMSLKDSENASVDNKVKVLASMPKLFMVFSGMVLNWAIYKYWLGKQKSTIKSDESPDSDQSNNDTKNSE